MHEGHDHHHHHDHDHDHGHHHDHDHSHGHEHGEASDKAMAMALLKYMAEHNRAHSEELEELADRFDEVTSDLIKEAVAVYSLANDKLDEALASAEAAAAVEAAAETPAEAEEA